AASHLSVGGQGVYGCGQAGACLQTMSVLQAYQADLLKELDEGEKIRDSDISELRRTADLSLRATKETARAIGRSMAALVAVERHLWLTLSDMKEKDRVFLLDAPLSPSGLFGDAVNSIVDRYQEAHKQVAVFQQFLPRRHPAHGAAEREQPRPSTSSSHRETQKQSEKCDTLRGRSANPAGASGRSGLQRASAPVSSAWKRSGAGELATPEGVSGVASSGASCRETVLAGLSMVLGPDFSPGRLSLGVSRQERSPLTGRGFHSSPPAGAVEALGVASEGAHLLASGLSTEVVETVLQSRAPSTRKLYALKWKLFTSWCGHRLQDPVNCPVGTALEFLQDRLSAGLTHSTLKVYVAAIAAYHAPLGGLSVGKDPLVTRFLRGALRLRPPVRPRVPTWDLSVVLEALCRPPFEPIEEISDCLLTPFWNLLQAYIRPFCTLVR
ncbi:hypothetical protein M9458_017445, partial [Cirrhinus mrigala]